MPISSTCVPFNLSYSQRQIQALSPSCSERKALLRVGLRMLFKSSFGENGNIVQLDHLFSWPVLFTSIAKYMFFIHEGIEFHSFILCIQSFWFADSSHPWLQDPSVMAASLCAIQQAALRDANSYKTLISSFASILKQVTEKRLPKAYDYHNVSAPFIQVVY